METVKTIQEIKDYMKSNKITQKELSDKSGIPLQTLRKIFSGLTANPRIDTMQAIEQALGFSADAEQLPNDVARLITAISTLSDDECKAVADYIDFVVSKREK